MAPDIARPEYGDIASAKLNEDSGKRESDADPDTEIHAPKESLPDSHADPPRRFSVPTLVVERTDDSPRYGDDFGRRASLSQRVAHELRAADAQPDQTIILPLKGEESDTSRNSSEDDSQRSIDGDSNNEEDEPAPLFRHETIATKSEVEDEVEPAPLFRHETIATGDVSQADVADYDEEEPIPLFRHETIPDHQDPTAFRRHSTHIEVPESPFTPGSSVEDVNENIRDTARNPDPVRVDDGMPLFSHECVPDEQGSRSMSQMSGRSKSGTSLQRIAEDPDDTPVEEFPTDKAEIVGKLQETKRRLSRDDSPVDENTSPSPIRPGASPRVSNYSAEAPSPLEPISEDVAVEDEEPLDSVPLSLSDPDLKLKTSEVREIGN
ncbi:hypothetical protein EJ05DRAFT_34254 [Pseudovirgaria hyperparasitica]|uniref:Uncharacterized protein n=1 Tax=Pseudovirgaria hyperparasitica TaxID=470096 RepID=A0A6A6WME3_9PEZI|nr:uncharacterized protein EJ05DRAFT_34254 [Pseudovirgaria hyperparasitica]KAF2763322.1 hypothetical protein EJ05DRAFT_34254 [Pseudovirgaria hyperparasitica]